MNWETLLWWGSVLSMVGLLGGLLGIPWAVARLPADYFTREQREVWRHADHEPWLAVLLGFAKNLLGAVLVLLGLVMLVTPGQGLLTLLIGLMLMNFPGKYRLERWLVRRPGVMRALNWLRRRQGEQPLEAPPGAEP